MLPVFFGFLASHPALLGAGPRDDQSLLSMLVLTLCLWKKKVLEGWLIQRSCMMAHLPLLSCPPISLSFSRWLTWLPIGLYILAWPHEETNGFLSGCN